MTIMIVSHTIETFIEVDQASVGVSVLFFIFAAIEGRCGGAVVISCICMREPREALTLVTVTLSYIYMEEILSSSGLFGHT